jgi:hypothetical protein
LYRLFLLKILEGKGDFHINFSADEDRFHLIPEILSSKVGAGEA